MCLSVPQTAVAATRMSTSSGPGTGTGQSRTTVPSCPAAGALLTTASMSRLLGSERVEKVAGEQVQGEAGKRHPRDVGEIRERRLQDQSVERVVLDHLRRHGTAERVAVDERREVAGADLFVKARRAEAVRDDAA